MDALSSTPQTTIQIRLLGPYRVLVNGQPRTQIINYDKARILLSMLAMAQGKPLNRGHLAETIWHEDPISTGRARLRHALHALRRAFADCDDVLHISHDTLSLNPQRVFIDVLALLQHASQPALSDLERLDLYDGTLLEQVKLHNGERLQDWLLDAQAQIRQTLVQCRDRYIQASLSTLPPSQAMAHIKRWLMIWPEEERLHQRLIELLKQEGQHDAAMQAYEQCSVLLADRLGCEPSPQTRQLVYQAERQTESKHDHKPAQAGLSLRPLAVVGFCLRFQAGHQHDREHSGEVIEQSSRLLNALIQQHGGWLSVAGHNQALAYFGYPDLLESPVSLAADLARAAAALRLDDRILLTIGIHADLVIDDQSGHPDPWGQLAQTVLPLSWQAMPGSPRVSLQASQRLLPEDVPVPLNGQAHELTLRLHRPGVDHSHLPSRIYGRSQEFDQLVQAWAQIGPNRPLHHIAIHGRARIGKSLLIQSLADYVQKTDHPSIALQCREDRRRQAWHPLRLWLHEQLLGQMALAPIDQSDPFSTQAVQAVLDVTAQQAKALSQWLQATPDEHEQNEPSTAQMEMFFNLLSGLSGTPRRRLLIIENMQWADPPTQKLVRLLAHATPRSPTLLITSSRTPSHGLERAERMALRPLDRTSINSLLGGQSRGPRLSRDNRSRLARLSGGNPGHAHDLLRHLELGSPANCAPSLTDLVCIQYHTLLPATRSILTTIALHDDAIAIEDIIAMLDMNADTLDSGLDTLVTLDLIERQGREIVCQPLVAQAIRQIALRREQQNAHQTIARYGIRRRHAPEVIAQHLCLAECADAAFWWQRAAREALHRLDLRDASLFLQRSLNRSELIDDIQIRHALQFECRMLQGTIESTLYGPASASTAMAYELGRYVQNNHDNDQVMVSLWSTWSALQAQGNFDQALLVARQLLALASETGHDQNRSWALYAIGHLELWRGNLQQAEETLHLSLAVLENLPASKGRLAIEEHYPQCMTLCTLAVTLALKGDTTAALQYVRQAVQSLRPEITLIMRSITYLFGMQALYLTDQLEDCRQLAEQSLKELQKVGSPEPWSALARSFLHYCQIMLYGRESSLQPLQDCVQIVQYGLPICVDGLMGRIARALIRLGRYNEAMPWLDKAAAQGLRYCTHSLSAELHCIRGDAWLALGEPGQARQQWALAETHMEKHGLRLYARWIEARRTALQRLKL
ncbi:MAG TPA: AAA family ATPase [Alcaligenes sp.]|nr:AAA family ATPase [Alcaligenes sp.]HRL26676.1 AAA family ATPase [Alcaligenes sp.]